MLQYNDVGKGVSNLCKIREDEPMQLSIQNMGKIYQYSYLNGNKEISTMQECGNSLSKQLSVQK